MTDADLGLCVVGPGGVADLHLQSLRALSGVGKCWVVGVDETEAASFAHKWEFPRATSNLAEALDDSSVDVVLVSSPTPLHAAQARAALQAGKHVIAEVPVALSLSEAEALAELAESTCLRLLVCQTMRSYPGVRELRRRVTTGSLRVSQIAGLFAVPRRHNEHWTGGTRTWVDNLLWHHGCHFVDASLFMLGDPRICEAAASAGQTNAQFGMTMDLTISFATSERQLVTDVLSYNTSHDLSEIRVFTDDELFTLNDRGLSTFAGETITDGPGWADLSAQDAALIDALTTGAASDFDIGQVLPTMRVLEELQRLGGPA